MTLNPNAQPALNGALSYFPDVEFPPGSFHLAAFPHARYPVQSVQSAMQFLQPGYSFDNEYKGLRRSLILSSFAPRRGNAAHWQQYPRRTIHAAYPSLAVISGLNQITCKR